MLKEVQKRAPKFIMTVGLPASGKSTFSSALVASGAWVRANQDDMGRKGCEELVSKTVPLVRQGQTHLILDRCHIAAAERKEWLDTLGGPAAKEIMCVFFDTEPEVCKRRAAARQNHPTIRAGGGARIIDDMAKQLERPQASEGFGSVEVIRSFEEAAALLKRLGAAAPTQAAAEEDGEEDTGEPGEVEAPAAAAEEEEAAAPSPMAAFLAWLTGELRAELRGDAEAEGLSAAVEVILGSALEAAESREDLEESLAAAVEVLTDAGARHCAGDLRARWLALVPKR